MFPAIDYVELTEKYYVWSMITNLILLWYTHINFFKVHLDLLLDRFFLKIQSEFE